MNETAPVDPRDFDRWCTIFGVLSLDRTRGHLAAMGLFVPDESALQAGLRDLITRCREREDGSSQAVAAYLAETFRWVAEALGLEVAHHLRAWGEAVPLGSAPAVAQVFNWRHVVTRGGLDGSRDVGRVPDFVVSLRAELQKRRPASAVVKHPESEWDRAYFSRHDYDPTGGPGEINPLDLVENTIRHFTFCDAWEATTARSPSLEADLDELWRWGRREAERMNMPASLLERPGAWPPLPRPPRTG